MEIIMFPKDVANFLNRALAGKKRANADRLEAEAQAVRRVAPDAHWLDAEARLLRKEADEVDRKSRAANRRPWES
jgi:hypothetical protein